MVIGEKVRKRREELGWSQDMLAEKMGYKSKSSISKIEKGRPISQKIMYRLSNVLDVPIQYLMNFDNEQIKILPEDELSDEPKGLAAYIKSLRLIKHYTLEEMSEELNISLELLKEYESGVRKIPYSVIKKMAKYFNVDFVHLYVMEFEVEKDESELEATTKRFEQAEIWGKEFGKIVFTEEELKELMNFARYLISKRDK